jgi:hypothetical protein
VKTSCNLPVIADRKYERNLMSLVLISCFLWRSVHSLSKVFYYWLEQISGYKRPGDWIIGMVIAGVPVLLFGQ